MGQENTWEKVKRGRGEEREGTKEAVNKGSRKGGDERIGGLEGGSVEEGGRERKRRHHTLIV